MEARQDPPRAAPYDSISPDSFESPMLRTSTHRASLWRAGQVLLDLKRHWRRLRAQPRLDVLIVGAMRDEAQRRRFFAHPENRVQHASGARLSAGGVRAQLRAFNVTAAELHSRAGRKLARDLFIDCVRWGQARGAKVVLLADATRRLFGADGAELKALFPDLLFTTGDNGAALLLFKDVERALSRSFPHDPLRPLDRPRVAVLGADTRLGQALVAQLRAHDHEPLRCDAHGTGLAGLGRVDALVICSADPEARLDLERVQQLRRRHRRLLVIDGMDPPSLDADALAACGEWVLHQSASQASLPRLSWGWGHGALGASGRGRRLPGRYAEALALHRAVFIDPDDPALSRDWFATSPFHLHRLDQAFGEMGMGLDLARSVGKRLKQFDLRRRELALSQVEHDGETLPAPLSA